MKLSKYFPLLIFISFWTVRIIKIFSSINNGYLPDFRLFYLAVNSMYSKGANFDQIVKSSYGPPFIYVPFLIFRGWKFDIAEIAITVLSLVGYFLAFFLLWKKYGEKSPALFWILMGLISYSFPVIYSLGMGNPIGIVTLGVYGFYIFKNGFLKRFFFTVSTMIKIFPLAVLSPFVFFKVKAGELMAAIFYLAAGTLFSFLLLPQGIWKSYWYWIARIDPIAKTVINPAIYNQSFSSAAARIINITEFPAYYYYIFIGIIVAWCIAFVLIPKKTNKAGELDLMAFFLTAVLLIHPYPWQYYFAVLMPYLIVKITSKDFWFLLPLAVMSIDGNRLPGLGLLTGLLSSSQFFASIILLSLITGDYIAKMKSAAQK